MYLKLTSQLLILTIINIGWCQVENNLILEPNHKTNAYSQKYHPIVKPDEYPYINLLITPEQFAQLIQRQTSILSSGQLPTKFGDDQYVAVGLYLLVSSIMEYLTQAQQILKLPVIETGHAPLNAAIDMINQLELIYAQMIMHLKVIDFDDSTFNNPVSSNESVQILVKLELQFVQNEGVISGGDGILELYQIYNCDPSDHNTRYIIENLRITFQTCSDINKEAILLTKLAIDILQKLNVNTFLTDKNYTTLEKVPNKSEGLSAETFAKLIDTEVTLLSETKPFKSRIDFTVKRQIFAITIDTAIKMLDNLLNVFRLDAKSTLAPYVTSLKLIKQAVYNIQRSIDSLLSIKSKTIRRNSGIFDKSYDELVKHDEGYGYFWYQWKFVLQMIKDKLSRIRTAFGKGVNLIELYLLSNISPDDSDTIKAFYELADMMLESFPVIYRVKYLLDKAIAITDHKILS